MKAAIEDGNLVISIEKSSEVGDLAVWMLKADIEGIYPAGLHMNKGEAKAFIGVHSEETRNILILKKGKK